MLKLDTPSSSYCFLYHIIVLHLSILVADFWANQGTSCEMNMGEMEWNFHLTYFKIINLFTHQSFIQ